MTPTRAQLIDQLADLRRHGLFDPLAASAHRAGLPVALFVAIASRETNCHNILGDYQGGQYHGVGLVQIDIQHPAARASRDSGAWRTAAGITDLLDIGAAMLADNLAKARAAGYLAYEDYQVAADGYNAGMGRALRAAAIDQDDAPTTGHDYGSDVVARYHVFADLLGCPP